MTNDNDDHDDEWTGAAWEPVATLGHINWKRVEADIAMVVEEVRVAFEPALREYGALDQLPAALAQVEAHARAMSLKALALGQADLLRQAAPVPLVTPHDDDDGEVH